MSNILNIGTGGAGNKLLEAFLNEIDIYEGLQSTYDGLYINSNVNEMSKLEHFSASLNGLLINGNGTGRNPIKAKESIKLEKSKISNYFANRIGNYDIVNILSSADGGFGNGSISIITNIIRRLNKDIKINLLIAYPKTTSRKSSLENCLNLYSDILKLKNNEIINSILFIDNDKMKDENEFNKKVMKLYLESMELGSGELDSNDSKLINSASGYKQILSLDIEYKNNLQLAVDKAFNDSPFINSKSYKCTHIGAILEEDCFKKEEIVDIFTARDFDKIDYGNKNIIVVGGCKMPTEHMNTLKNILQDIDDEFNLEEDTFIFSNNSINKSVTKKSSEVAPKKSLRDLMDDDFWD